MSRTAKEKRADIWMPLYIADYLADTSHLSTEEHGAYLLLLMNAWTNEGSLPANEERLRRITRMDRAAWEVSWPELKTFFYEEGDQLRHHRLDAEFERAQANVKQRSEAGKASAEKRRLEREAQRKAKELANENSTSVATDVETDDATNDQRNTQRNGRPSPSPTPTTTDTSVSSVVSETRTPARNRDGIPVPENFTPDKTARLKSAELGIDAEFEADRFIAHHQAEGTLLADNAAWQAKFRKWLLDQHQFNADRERVTQSRIAVGQSKQASMAADCAALGVGSQYRETPFLEAAQHALS
ncbi:DUF1376 domain-containing protein [Chromobacterium phragmitis]|uniref:YdaU family protein n=1 Tax=Chromobacterium amazonense TaxID=1382803 RepID=UPI0021B769B9|nr:DUF1376 domain-containing protein [Chromobacterium amazonense]MBM2884074.1 DUF1376 domain-containing protein [Chromobacterium amazonense]